VASEKLKAAATVASGTGLLAHRLTHRSARRSAGDGGHGFAAPFTDLMTGKSTKRRSGHHAAVASLLALLRRVGGIRIARGTGAPRDRQCDGGD